MTIIDFIDPAQQNPYEGDVADLIAAGENKATEYTVPEGEVTKVRRLFGKAANAQDKTARLRVEAPGAEQGTTRLVFTLVPKHKAGRGRKSDAAPEAASEVAPEPAPEPTTEKTTSHKR